jgi:hypothetical protein
MTGPIRATTAGMTAKRKRRGNRLPSCVNTILSLTVSIFLKTTRSQQVKKSKKKVFSYTIEQDYFNFTAWYVHYQKVNPGLLPI